MTIDEAIHHCREQVQEQAKKGCYSCAEEHQQLAEWLKELKAYKEQSGKRMNVEEKERLIKKDIASIENKVRHAFNQGYEMGLKESRSENPNTCGDAISREELIEALDTWDKFGYAPTNELIPLRGSADKDKYVPYIHYDDVIKCIKGMPSVTKQPCGDAISRQAVLDGLASIAKAKAKSDAQKSLMGRVMFFTEKLPSVTPQQRTGLWEWVRYDGLMGNWHCSECRTIIPHMPEETDNTPIYKWCPMCGAKMEVEE